jgi:hypothetical protein
VNHYQPNERERVVISTHPCEGLEDSGIILSMALPNNIRGLEFVECIGLARLLDSLVGNKALMEAFVSAMTTNDLCDKLGHY